VSLEDCGSIWELLDSAALESASKASLLTGSWLSGMSRILLELDCMSGWLELAGPSVWLELAGLSSTSVFLDDELWGSSLLAADVLSSQAFRVNSVAIPREVAIENFAVVESETLPKTLCFSSFIIALLCYT